MKNLNLMPLVLCCLFYVGSAFANVKTDLPAQVTSPPVLNGNHLALRGLALGIQGNSCVEDQLGEPNRGPFVFVAYGQQETDPTWFDPWRPNQVGGDVSRKQADLHKNNRKAISMPPVRHKTPVRHFVKAEQKVTR
jgi:hypothetical protein